MPISLSQIGEALPSDTNIQDSTPKMDGFESDAGLPHLILLRGGHFADFTIQSQGCDFLASRVLVFCHSGYFRRFLLSDNKAVHDTKVQLNDVPACLIARFITFCYDPESYPESIKTSDYAQSTFRSMWPDDYHDAVSNNLAAAQLAIKLFEFSDRFDVPELKSKARMAFLRAWSNIDHKTHSGLTPRESTFDSAACKGTKAFADMVRQIYSPTHPNDRGLRDIVFRTIKWHTLYYNHFKQNKRFIHQVIEDNPAVALDLALYTLSTTEYVCEECEADQQGFVIYPCSCDLRSPHCEEKQCVAARRDRVFCVQCCKLGTFDLIPVYGPEDIHVPPGIPKPPEPIDIYSTEDPQEPKENHVNWDDTSLN